MEKRIYQLQTKLYHIEDILVSWGPIRLTLRQCGVLVLGGCGSLNLWSLLAGLAEMGSTGLAIRMTLVSLPTLQALLVATVRVADRYAEVWVFVMLHYSMHPSISIWLPQGARRSSRRGRNRRRGRPNRDKRTTTHLTREEELL